MRTRVWKLNRKSGRPGVSASTWAACAAGSPKTPLSRHSASVCRVHLFKEQQIEVAVFAIQALPKLCATSKLVTLRMRPHPFRRRSACKRAPRHHSTLAAIVSSLKPAKASMLGGGTHPKMKPPSALPAAPPKGLSPPLPLLPPGLWSNLYACPA